ncbi:MAG: protein kinase [Lentisphaeraceae bacterium]|nr:protein kinase [Lentisphaeraceae bacterium]
MPEESISEDFLASLKPMSDAFDSAFSTAEESLLKQELKSLSERYIDEVEIDSGGMKRILSVNDTLSVRTVAKAVPLKTDGKSEDSFIKEARLTASLQHPNIIPVYDLGLKEETPYFTMKLVEGENLSDLLEAQLEGKKLLALQDLMQIFLKVCDAISYAHSKNIIHLDLKPANIRLGGYGEVIVCDWGLAKIIGQVEDERTLDLDPDIHNDLTLNGVVKGSLGYLAPEQVSDEHGQKDKRTDVFALGGILYSMLTNIRPIEAGDTESSLKATLEGNVTFPNEIDHSLPQSLSAVAMKALSVSQNQRYQSVDELSGEVKRWLAGFATEAENASFFKSVSLLISRHKTVSYSLLVIVFISSILGWKFLERDRAAMKAELLYVQQKESHRQESIEDAELLKEMSYQLLKDYSFEEALELADSAVTKDPENETAQFWKVKVLVMRQEFNLATKILESLAPKYHKRYMNISRKYGSYKEDKDFLPVDLLKEFYNDLAHIQYSFFVCAYINMNSTDLDYRVASSIVFMKDVINQGVTSWDYDIQIDDGYVIVDFSGTHDLKSLAGVRNLPIKKLNLQGTQVTQTLDLLNMPLEELNIANVDILDPRPILRIPTLKVLVLGKEQYKDLKIPKRIQVVRL